MLILILQDYSLFLNFAEREKINNQWEERAGGIDGGMGRMKKRRRIPQEWYLWKKICIRLGDSLLRQDEEALGNI